MLKRRACLSDKLIDMNPDLAAAAACSPVQVDMEKTAIVIGSHDEQENTYVAYLLHKKLSTGCDGPQQSGQFVAPSVNLGRELTVEHVRVNFRESSLFTEKLQ
jgi:hypothetical protein